MWTESSMVRVYPRATPPAARSSSVRLELARGEYQSFQIVLRPRPGHALRNVRLAVGDLSGATSIASANIEWHQVGYVRVDNLDYKWLQPNVSVALAAGAELPGWWPDPLLPVDGFDVAPEFTQPVWVTVYAPPDTPPGECAGTITVMADGEAPRDVRLRAKVHDFALPPGAGTFPTAFGLMEDELERVYGRLDVRLRRAYGDFVLRHRINPGSIYRTEPPIVSDLEHYLARGMNAFNVIYNGKAAPTESIGGGSPRAREKVRRFLAELGKSRHAQRIFDMAYYYGFDEVTVERLHFIRDEFRAVREEFGLPTFTTSHVPQKPEELRKLNVDWLCPITYWLKREDVARCRRAGFKIWTYVSLEPYVPYANVRLDCPLIESRVLFWQMRREELDGFLYWAFNAWRSEGNDRPIDPRREGPFLKWDVCSRWTKKDGSEARWLHGDGRLLYPGPRGPIGCIRLANMRDGLQDLEYLRLLSERTGRPADALDACAPVTADLTHYTREPVVLETQRRLIARRICGG
jgi:hypothetical protein